VVSHVDFAPTMLELLGIQPDAKMQGKSLIAALNGSRMRERAAYSESMFPQFHYGWSPLKAVTTSQYKFIEAPKPELYDRKADPGELKNIDSQKPDVVAEMRKELSAYLKLDTVKPAPKQVDPETEEKLRALGYVGTIAPAGSRSSNVDPKDRIDVLETLSKAGKALEARNYQYVLQAMEWVNKQDPNIVDAHFLASSAHLHLGNKEKALEEMLRTISLKPDHTQTLYNLALYYQLQNNVSEAEHWYLQLLKYEPESLYGNLNLAALYLNSSQAEKAKPYLTKVFQSYEKTIQTTASPQSKSNLLEKAAEIYFRAGDLKKSEEEVNRAIQYTPRRAILYFHLGNIYRNANDMDRSVQSFRKAIQMNPRFYPAYYALAETYYVTNTNLEEALRLTEAVNQALPNAQGQQLADAIRKKLNTKAQGHKD
jgi:tetratricopeptide (TPR) repeat protein